MHAQLIAMLNACAATLSAVAELLPHPFGTLDGIA